MSVASLIANRAGLCFALLFDFRAKLNGILLQGFIALSLSYAIRFFGHLFLVIPVRLSPPHSVHSSTNTAPPSTDRHTVLSYFQAFIGALSTTQSVHPPSLLRSLPLSLPQTTLEHETRVDDVQHHQHRSHHSSPHTVLPDSKI